MTDPRSARKIAIRNTRSRPAFSGLSRLSYRIPNPIFWCIYQATNHLFWNYQIGWRWTYSLRRWADIKLWPHEGDDYVDA